MIDLDKKAIKYIALSRLWDKDYKSVYECWNDALEIWLKENNYVIIKKPDEEREAISNIEPEG